jgi:uncharacterized protein (UPF0335 family)
MRRPKPLHAIGHSIIRSRTHAASGNRQNSKKQKTLHKIINLKSKDTNKREQKANLFDFCRA